MSFTEFTLVRLDTELMVFWGNMIGYIYIMKILRANMENFLALIDTKNGTDCNNEITKRWQRV